MRILLADQLPDEHVMALGEAGHECAAAPGLTADDLADALAGVEVLVVRSTLVTAEVLAAADRLRLVIRAGSGTNTIDTDAAAAADIAVCNVPGRNAAAVAELAFGLILALDRNIPDNVADLRAGRWRKRHYATARGLKGSRLGIVGLGDVGLALATRAAAFDMGLHAIDKPGRPADAARLVRDLDITLVADLDALAGACDILSFHVPLTDGTRGIIGSGLLDRMASGGWIINTARGELVDEDALLAAMDAKAIRVGLDVFADEPDTAEAPFSSRLAAHPNVYGTHHIGASTAQAQHAVAAEVVRIVAGFDRGELLHCVNGVDGDDTRPASDARDGVAL